MYKLIEKRIDRCGFYISEKYVAYIIKSNKSLLIVTNHQNEFLFTSEEMRINQFAIIEDLIIYTARESDITKIYDLNTKEEVIVDTYFYGISRYSQYINSFINSVLLDRFF